MQTYARIVNGHAVDVTVGDLAELFHPEVAAEFVVVPDGTCNGDHFDGTVWTKYVPPAAVAPVFVPPTVSPATFKMLMLPYLPKILPLADTDITIKAFLDVVNDPRLTEVILSLTSVQNGIKYCLSKIGLTDEQAANALEQICSGVLV